MTTAVKLALAIGGGVVVGLGGARAYLARASAPVAPPAVDSVSRAPDLLLAQRTKGDSAAPITVFEVSDFQCPYCRQFWVDTKPLLEREYIQRGKVKFVFINFPIPAIHQNAAAAHAFAMCAARTRRFWPVYDLLFRHQGRWNALGDPAPYFMGLADSASLDRGAIAGCLRDGATRWLVDADAEAARRGGISSTPSFIVEGGLLVGAHPIATWRTLLDSLYRVKTAAKTPKRS